MPLVELSAQLIEGFAGAFLSPRYDNPMPTPQFHREAWELYSSSHSSCMVIAPRDHAKSTGLTFDYILAEVLFRRSDYVILIGSTEDKAAEQLSNISEELHENKDLREEFGVQSFETEQKTEIIVIMDDGHRFRILARGAEQKIRGAMWKGKRPNLIVCDDMEDDEQVESSNRRLKFRRWFFRAAKQALSKGGRIRVHGTILHEDSLLSRLRKNSVWKHQFYKAHEAYDDFSNILWPQRWTEEQLRLKRREFEEDGDASGYAQEFLNDPQDMADAYLRPQQFLPMDEDDHEAEKRFYLGCDFAVSKADNANRTAFTCAGRDLTNLLHYVDQRVGRWDTLEWITELFSMAIQWNPDYVYVEDGVIWKSMWPIIRNEMNPATRSPQLREIFKRKEVLINFVTVPSVKDKATRGRSFQRRMKAGLCRFDKEADWYQGYEMELLKFTGVTEAKLDDQFDSSAIICVGLDQMPELDEEDFDVDDPIEMEEVEYYRSSPMNRSRITGY